MAPVFTVSCHVERPLDDRVWARFVRLLEAQPGGVRVAALIRPPFSEAGEREAPWLERVRAIQGLAPFGHHTHFGGPTQARPKGGDPLVRFRAEADWLAAEGLRPTFWCGGAWYVDAAVAGELAARGYADCTALPYRMPFLDESASRFELAEPTWLETPRGRFLEVPTTHALGDAARALLRRRSLGEGIVHVHFHDWELVEARRRAALHGVLRVLARRGRVADLDELAAELGPTTPTLPLAAALRGSPA